MPIEHADTNMVLNAVFHVFFLHGLVPEYNNSIIGVEWYLGILAIFILVCPLIYRYINSIEKILFFIITANAGSLGVVYTLNNIFIGNDLKLYVYVNEIGIIPQFTVIVLGVFLFILQSKCHYENVVKNRELISYSILLVSVLLLWGEISLRNNLFTISIYMRYGLWFCGIIASQMIYPCKLLINKFWAKIGEISYPIYLFHFSIYKILYQMIDVGNQIFNIIIRFVMTMIVSFIVALLITKYVETPSVKLMKNICLRKI